MSISDIIANAKKQLTQQNIANVIHWTAVISGSISVVVAVIVPGNEKAEWYGIAITCMTVAQILHKFTDALDHKQTLAEAVEVSLPAIQAAATGNIVQKQAVSDVVTGEVVKVAEAVTLPTSKNVRNI